MAVFKLENPTGWIGYEAEALLACESGNGRDKELCVVTAVRDEKPEAFYRVKCAGAIVQDSSNWKKAVDAFNRI